MHQYLFQYCQKIIILSRDKSSVLLCKRFGEADYDGVFTFIGGKMETTDAGLMEGLQREKNEEVGSDFKIKIYPTFSINRIYKKKDGNTLILPHYLAIHEEGEVVLNTTEYSEYKWVPLSDLKIFEPKVPNIPEIMEEILKLEQISNEKDFVIL